MNYTTAVFLINTQVRAVQCTYEAHENAERITFKTMDPDIKVGTYVVTPASRHHKMVICKVVSVDVDVDFDSPVLME